MIKNQDSESATVYDIETGATSLCPVRELAQYMVKATIEVDSIERSVWVDARQVVAQTE